MKTYNKYTFQELLNIFPTSKPITRKRLKNEIKQLKDDLDQALVIEREFNNEILSRVKYDNRWFWIMVRDIMYVGPWRDDREKKIRRNHFLLNSLNYKTTPLPRPDTITDSDIVHAKEIPIETFYEGHLHQTYGRAVGKCPFHNEDTPSFTIYLDQNTFYCFGCCAAGDVIDFIMKKDDCNFIVAVKTIINK